MLIEPYRLIVADDEEDMREWLGLVLAPLRPEIREAGTGRQLLALLALGPAPHLVITDVRMPAPDGLTVLAASRDAGSRVPFLIISGFADEEVRARAAALGAAVLAKPFTARQLLTAVRELLPPAVTAPVTTPDPEAP